MEQKFSCFIVQLKIKKLKPAEKKCWDFLTLKFFKMKKLNQSQMANLNGGECRLFPGSENSDNNVFEFCFTTCGLGQFISGVDNLPNPIICTK